MDRKCKNCQCWKIDGTGENGLCTARAPIPLIVIGDVTGKQIPLILPKTKSGDGCYHDFVEAK